MYKQAGRFIPKGASQDSIKTETPKKKKGKEKRECKQNTKTKARSRNTRAERPQSSSAQLQNLHLTEVMRPGSVIWGTAWGMGPKESYCSELGFIW